MELVILLTFCVLLGVVVWLLVSHPRTLLGLLGLLVLVASCYRADAAERFDVTVVIETADDLDAANRAVSYAAGIFGPQAGIEVVAVQVEVGSIAEGTTHAHTLLDAVKVYRFAKGYDATSDATIFLTRRTLTRGYQGIATIGPACSAAASVVVTLRDDGFDGQILAHELAHTFGLMHDAAPGWLMSDAPSRVGADEFSPDSLASLKATPLDCMPSGAALPTAQGGMVERGAASVPAGTSGGGGAFDIGMLVMLVALATLGFAAAYERRRADKLRDLVHELEGFKPPAFALNDISGNPTPDIDDEVQKRYLHIEFTSLAGLVEFNSWLHATRFRYRREGWPAIKP